MRVPGVTSAEDPRATKGHGSPPAETDAEPRKHGVRSVLETPVVRAVNDGCRAGALPWPPQTRSTSPGKQPQGRGPNVFGGNFDRWWRMWFNSTVLGAPYQPECRPSSALMRRCGGAGRRRCMAVVSSCRKAWRWVAQRTQSTRLGRSPGCRCSRPALRPLACLGVWAAVQPAGGRSQVNMA